MFLLIDREMQRVLRSLPQENANRVMLGVVMFVLGSFMFGLAAGYAVPADLFSTALWFDNQGMPLVFDVRFSLWNLLGGGRTTSIEGAVFSIIITLMTWSMAFKSMRALAQTQGDYGGGYKNPLSLAVALLRGSLQPRQVDWDVVAPMIQMWILVLFDVFTGASFRASGQAGWATSFAVAFLFENILSDSALIAGFQLAITGGMVLYKLFRAVESSAPPAARQQQAAANRQQQTNAQRTPPPPPMAGGRGLGRMPALNLPAENSNEED